MVNLVDWVLLGDEAVFEWVAVLADGNWRTLKTVVVSSGLVDGAGLIRSLMEVQPGVSVDSVTSMATVGYCVAGNQYLRTDVDVRPGCLSSDLDSVTQRGSCGVGPA